MYFKLTGIVDGFALQFDMFEAHVTSPLAVNVSIQRSLPNDRLISEPGPWAHFSAEANMDISAGIDRHIAGRVEPFAFHGFPVDLQRELARHRAALTDAVHQVVNTLRWRFAMRGSTHPLINLELSYSFDGQHWGYISNETHYRLWEDVGAPHSYYIGKDAYDEARCLIEDRKFEPIGHDVFREAWSLRWDNPRSALIIGVVAIEVGTKRCIATLDSASEQSMRDDKTPLINLLQERLPGLLANRPGIAELAPSEEVIATVQEGARARNALVHRFPGDPKYDRAMSQLTGPRIDELLSTVADLLWLYDFYVGHSWAKQFVRPQTLQSLLQASKRTEGK